MSLADSFRKLNELDVSDLELENIGSWPAAVKAIVYILLLSGLLYAGYLYHIEEILQRLDRVAAEEQTLKDQFSAKAFSAANLEAYREQMVEMEKSFGALVKQLPSKTEVPGLLEDITHSGTGSGLVFSTIKLQREITRGFYIELPISIVVQGNYHELGSFVSSVAALPRIVTLHDFSIKPVKGGGELLNMSIVAKTYRYNEKGGASSAKKKKKK